MFNNCIQDEDHFNTRWCDKLATLLAAMLTTKKKEKQEILML